MSGLGSLWCVRKADMEENTIHKGVRNKIQGALKRPKENVGGWRES